MHKKPGTFWLTMLIRCAILLYCNQGGEKKGSGMENFIRHYKNKDDGSGRNFTPVSLDFLGRTCYNQRSFILFKMLMRTNRGPALHAAERAAPQGCCKQPAMCRTSTTAECRGEPLPGAPVTAQRVARLGVQFGWNRGTLWNFQALHPVGMCGMKRFFVICFISQRRMQP